MPFYNKPRVGQAMRLRTSPTAYTDGFVSAVDVREGTVTRPDGSTSENWSAEITSAFASSARITYATQLTPDSWRPIDAEEYDLVFGEGFALLREEMEALRAALPAGTEDVRPLVQEALASLVSLSERVAALEDAGLSEAVARHEAVLTKLANTTIVPATGPAPFKPVPEPRPDDKAIPQRRR